MHYGFTFVGIRLYSPLCDHEAKELPATDTEEAVVGVEAQFVSSDSYKDCIQVSCLMFGLYELDYYIININFHYLA